MLDRTPYGASRKTRVTPSSRLASLLHAFHADLAAAGYVVVLQDVRGKYKSEGTYVMNRPLRGRWNPDAVDHSTDAYDTIEWLLANVPECNGRVGTIGISYDGFTALMSLVDPHPALKACVPINPMVDNWIGDDWFQNGAFRQTHAAQYVYAQTTSKTSELTWPLGAHDQYEAWLEAGSAGAMAAKLGLDRLPFWRRLTEHPAYDAFWRDQALDRVLAAKPVRVPTLHVHSQWDAEDIHGALAVHAAMQREDVPPGHNRLVIGPWSHVGVGFDAGASLGAVKFGSETARWFRSRVMLPQPHRRPPQHHPSRAPPWSRSRPAPTPGVPTTHGRRRATAPRRPSPRRCAWTRASGSCSTTPGRSARATTSTSPIPRSRSPTSRARSERAAPPRRTGTAGSWTTSDSQRTGRTS
jgi:putative CocE/NonD family hydrolase